MKGLYLAHTEVGCVHVSSWGLWGLYLVLPYNLMHAILFILFSLIGLYMVVGNGGHWGNMHNQWVFL